MRPEFEETFYLDRYGNEIYMDNVYIDPTVIAEQGDPEYNEKYEFEANYYIEHKIREFLGKPPQASWIETEWQGYEGSSDSISYAAVRYYYRSTRKKHREYMEKVEDLICSKKYEKSCEKDFNDDFRKFVKNKYKDIYGLE